MGPLLLTCYSYRRLHSRAIATPCSRTGQFELKRLETMFIKRAVTHHDCVIDVYFFQSEKLGEGEDTPGALWRRVWSYLIQSLLTYASNSTPTPDFRLSTPDSRLQQESTE